MSDVKVVKSNESFLKLYVNDSSISDKLWDYFSFFADSYLFDVRYRNKVWDGKIRLYNKKDSSLPIGLLSNLKYFCEEKQYVLELEDSLLHLYNNYTNEDVTEFLSKLNLPNEARYYQVDYLREAFNRKKMIALSPTGCVDPKTLVNVEIDEDDYNFLQHLRGK